MGDVQGREKDLKEKVAQLQKQVEELTVQLADKNEVIHTLTTDMAKMVRMCLDIVFFFSDSFIYFILFFLPFFVCGVCVCVSQRLEIETVTSFASLTKVVQTVFFVTQKKSTKRMQQFNRRKKSHLK